MAKLCRSCTNCQVARRGCIRSSADGPCLRCASFNPPLKCIFATSSQGKRTDLLLSPTVGSSSCAAVARPRPSRNYPNVANMSKPVRDEVHSPTDVTPAQGTDEEGEKDWSLQPSTHLKIDNNNNTVGDTTKQTIDNNNHKQNPSTHGLTAHASTIQGYEEVALFTPPSLPGGCIGHRCLFEVTIGSNDLIKYNISARTRHNTQCTNVAFIENTTFLNSKMKRNCCGALVIYGIHCHNDNCTYYYLGIIAGLFYRTQTFSNKKLNIHDGALYVYEWTGDTTIINGGIVPTLFTEESESGIMKHLTLKYYKFNKANSLPLYFVNQFSGTLPSRGKIAPELVNHIDLCLQCSPSGGDYFPTPVRRVKDKEEYLKPLERLPVTTDDTNHPPVIRLNPDTNSQWRSSMIKNARDAGDKEIAKFNTPPKRIPVQDAKVSVAVVTLSNGQPLDLNTATRLDPSLVGMHFVPSLSDFINESCTQKVYAIDNDQYKKLKKYNIVGLPYQDAEDTIKENSTVCIKTLCINI